MGLGPPKYFELLKLFPGCINLDNFLIYKLASSG